MTAGRPPGSIDAMETTLPAVRPPSIKPGQCDQRSFLLQRAQPAMAGL
jgi:hypothetical protein